MDRKLVTLVGLVATSLWSVANATTVTFSGTTQNNSSTGQLQPGGNGGMYFSQSSSTSGQQFGSITVFGETDTQTGDGGAGTFITPNGTTGLFEVTNTGTCPPTCPTTGNNTATGIAPYITVTGGGTVGNLNFTVQPGIASSHAADSQSAAPTDQVLLLNLGNIGANSTISFIMETGVSAPGNTGINVYSGVSSTMPTGMGASQGTDPLAAISTLTGVSVNGSGGGEASTSFNFKTATAGDQWIAIQADCHYLVLNSITFTPSGVPEPSFYGFIALAMVGLVFGARKMRARAAAAEKA